MSTYYRLYGPVRRPETRKPPHDFKGEVPHGDDALTEEDKVRAPVRDARTQGRAWGTTDVGGSLSEPGVQTSWDKVAVQAAGDPRSFQSLRSSRHAQAGRGSRAGRGRGQNPANTDTIRWLPRAASQHPARRPSALPFSPSVWPPGRGRRCLGPCVCSHTGQRHTRETGTVAWLCWGANRGLHTRESARRQGNVLLSSSTKRWLLK